MDKKIIIVGVGVIAVIGAGIFLWGNNAAAPAGVPDTTGHSEPSVAPGVSDTVAGTLPVSAPGAEKQFTVTAQNYSFSLKTIPVKRGDTVKITVQNAGGFHDFRIDEFNVATKRINGGEEDVVQFVADKSGTFEFYCSVGSHRAMGMKGTLVVGE